MHIVLFEPEIPQNTGNIARTCALTCTSLHLIKPLGFLIEDRYLKRAGLDYWDKVDIKMWNNFREFKENYKKSKIYLATTKGLKRYDEIAYKEDDVVVFGPESKGLPYEILNAYPESQVKIPMLDIGRSLNLANSAAVIIYEALRQLKFPYLK
jgi:tRNA (cytidine/uridine-2'-O-)-methyltransferase